jgi:hypothetical protein
VRFLHRRRPARRAISRTLDEMKSRHRREALQVLHGERQWTVNHPVDHETMRLGIDFRNVGAAGRPHEVERGRCDHSH